MELEPQYVNVFPKAVELYLSSRNPTSGTRSEYKTTVRKWRACNKGGPIEKLNRQAIREFLNWSVRAPPRMEERIPAGRRIRQGLNYAR